MGEEVGWREGVREKKRGEEDLKEFNSQGTRVRAEGFRKLERV